MRSLLGKVEGGREKVRIKFATKTLSRLKIVCKKNKTKTQRLKVLFDCGTFG